MYHALLTNRYLTSRVIPLIAVAAVALCVALVIIVVSVMTGFLNMVKDSGRTLIGDVVVSYAVSGIPHYQKLIQRIEALPEAAAATPVLDTWGLVRMPYPPGDDKQVEFVQLWGIEPESFSKVTGFEKTLHWKTPDEHQRQMLIDDALAAHWQDVVKTLDDEQRFRLLKAVSTLRNNRPETILSDDQLRARARTISEEEWRTALFVLSDEDDELKNALGEDAWNRVLALDARLVNPDQLISDGVSLTRNGQPAIVLGMHVSDGNERTRAGTYTTMLGYWMPRFDVTITTLPVVGGGLVEPESMILPVANEFSSGVYLIDDTRAMIPLESAQRLMHLNEAQRVDPADPSHVLGVDPARATLILVRAKPYVTPEQLRDAVADAYSAFEQEMAGELVPPPYYRKVTVNTWAQQQAQFIGPVEKEREMMRTLFSLVYIVCAGLVLAIFWAIVYEKTRDIGILRSVGASRIGISWIFLRYGLVVGVLGAIVGLGLGTLIVRKINLIHEALSDPPLAIPITVLAFAAVSLIITLVKAVSGNLLPVVLGGLITAALLIAGFLSLWLYHIGGFLMWDPRVYYFEKIPNQVDVESAIITMIGAVVFSLIGAFVPAAKAADTDPVRALRYE